MRWSSRSAGQRECSRSWSRGGVRRGVSSRPDRSKELTQLEIGGRGIRGVVGRLRALATGRPDPRAFRCARRTLLRSWRAELEARLWGQLRWVGEGEGVEDTRHLEAGGTGGRERDTQDGRRDGDGTRARGGSCGSAGPSYLVRGKLNRVNPSLEARDGGADVPRDQATTAARSAHALADPGSVSPPAGTRRPGTPRDPGEGWRSLRPGLRHDRKEVMP